MSLVACDGDQLVPANAPPAGSQPQTDNGQPTPPTADELLAQLEQAGREHPAIQADTEYKVDQQLTGDSEHRSGSVKYQADTPERPAMFYVVFNTLKLGEGPTMADKVEYAFDGHWLTIAKHRIKQMTRYEVAPAGERVEAFKLGKGPFPLPFGQTAETMNKYFVATTEPAGQDAPQNSDCLLLLPRDEYAEELNFTRLAMWVDRTSHLPVKLISADKSENITTVSFTNIDSSPSFNEADFHPRRPAGWQYSQESLHQADNIAP